MLKIILLRLLSRRKKEEGRRKKDLLSCNDNLKTYAPTKETGFFDENTSPLPTNSLKNPVSGMTCVSPI
ncbi:hypothetical protein [Phormidium nigroviride]